MNLGLMAAALGPTLTGIRRNDYSEQGAGERHDRPVWLGCGGCALIGGGLTLAIKAAGAEARSSTRHADAFENHQINLKYKEQSS